MKNVSIKKFKMHANYFKPVPKPEPNPNLETKLIRCANCNNLYVSTTTETARCPHCFKKMILNNPNRYMKIKNLDKQQVKKYNSDRALLNYIAQSRRITQK